MKRKGMGTGRGKGFKNIIGQDPTTHSNNARGISSNQRLAPMQSKEPEFEEDNVVSFETEIEPEFEEEMTMEMSNQPMQESEPMDFSEGVFSETFEEPFIPEPPLPPELERKTFRQRVGETVEKFRENLEVQREKREEQKEFLEGLSDAKLRDLAVKEESKGGFFGEVFGSGDRANIYEKELIRRETKKVQLDERLKLARKSVRTKVKQGIEKSQGKGVIGQFGDFLFN